ncbi:MAG: hypothetical protein IT233_00715 [Bacteroidia bacterium]|nr:hypothetical protein [Bacteroidia bacterium]
MKTQEDYSCINPSDTSFVVVGHSEDMGKWYGHYYKLKTNVPDGEYDFYVNGKLELKAFIKNSQYDGVWSYYFHQGNLKEVKPYVNGKLDGENISFYARGSISRKTKYVDDNGVSTVEYYESGNIKSKSSQSGDGLYYKEYPDSLQSSTETKAEIKIGTYNCASKSCPSIVLLKNGKFYFTKTEKEQKQNGTWELNGDTLLLYYEYEVNKENKGRKISNYEYPSYQLIKATSKYIVSEESLILMDNHNPKFKYDSCNIFVFEK